MSLKSLLVIFFIFFCLSSYSANIQGVALLSGATDHSGITVTFIAKSQSAVGTSASSIADGSYTATVVTGVYDIRYSKADYHDVLIADQFLNADATLSQVTLSNEPIVIVNAGDVSGTWTNTNTYMVEGDLIVPEGQELIIEEGTTVKFTGYYSLVVLGKLTAIGSPEKRITFTSSKLVKARGDWSGIQIFNETGTTDTTKFDYCTLEYAAAEDDDKAIIYSYGYVKINHSLLRGSGYGGVVNSYGYHMRGYMEIRNTEITDVYFYAIASRAKGVVIEDNNIHDVDLIGIQYTFGSSDDKVRGNRINNVGYAGIQMWGNGLVDRNIISNCEYGIFLVDGNPAIRNNSIVKNKYGIGLYDDNQPAGTISSNIIADNTGYAIFCTGTYKPEKVEYNLIHNNGGGIANAGPVGLGQIVTTTPQGYDADTYYNIFEAPEFYSTNEQDENFLYLIKTSAAVDSGDPQFKDDDNSIIDCGAIPFQKYRQSIAFDEIEPKTFGDNDFTLVATSSGALPVTFKSSNTNVAVIEGSTLKIIGDGPVTITATQAGNEDFGPAFDIAQTICISPVTPAISLQDDMQTLTSSADAGNQWYLDGTLIANATTRTFKPSDSGIYTVQVQSGGCPSAMSESFEMLVVGVEAMISNVSIHAYPNPAVDQLNVSLDGDGYSPFSFKLINPLGIVMASGTTNEGEKESIDTKGLAPGIYTLVLSSKEGVFTKHILKR